MFVNLFLCLEFYYRIKIDRSGYFVYNSNRPTGRLPDSGFGLIDKFSDRSLLVMVKTVHTAALYAHHIYVYIV